MSDLSIYNAIPSYKDAPISLDILKNNTSKILKLIHSKNIEKNYIILGENQENLEEKIKLEALEYQDLNIEIIKSDSSIGYVYENESAVKKVIEGEKPIPLSKNKGNLLFSIEELLDIEKKEVYIQGKVKNKGKQSFSKKITPKEILKFCEPEGEVKGIFIGFPEGKFIGEDQFDKPLNLNSDIIRIFNETDCILAQLKKVAEEFSKETCGRCVFGFEGVTQINLILSDILRKKGKVSDIKLIQDLCKQMKTQVVCGIDSILALSIESALENFYDEIVDHITKKTCKAVECNNFLTFHVLASKCIGCGDCIDECEDEAIIGKKKFVHVIDQDECTQCGKCIKACDKGAIVKAGAIKPKCPPKPIPCRKK